MVTMVTRVISWCGHTAGLRLTLLSPHGRHDLGLGLQGDEVEPGGADLHVLNIVTLRADSLSDGVAVLPVLDQHAVTDVLLDTVRGEGRYTDLSPLVQVVHSTARPALHTTTLLAVLNRLGMLLLVLLVLVVLELVVDEGSRSAIVLSRSAVVVSWLAMADTGVDPGTAVTGAVVVLSFTDQIESADDENLNKSLDSQTVS